MINLRPHYIRVTHAGQEATLVHYRLGQGERRILVIAGVHGREHGGVQAAYELVERLAGMSLHGGVDVLPVCNPLAYAAETRFMPRSDRDMARAFAPDKPVVMTGALTIGRLTAISSCTHLRP